MSISIIIADDHMMLREGLKTILAQESDFAIVGEADNGVATVELARALAPEVILLDITMPELNGIEAARQILRETPAVEVIILSMHTDKNYILEAVKAGVKGFVVKSCACAELVRAIRVVACHQSYLSPSISGMLVEELVNPVSTKPHNKLSQREFQVLRSIAEGHNTKGIALMLEISTKTVETYRLNLMKKLNLTNVADLTRYAIKEGIISFQ